MKIEHVNAISLPARVRFTLNLLLKIQITPLEAARVFPGGRSSQRPSPDSYDARFVSTFREGPASGLARRQVQLPAGRTRHRVFIWCYILKMLRILVLIAFLLASTWQTAALARVGSSVVGLADVQHTQLHAQQIAHQHHDDGSYQVDNSLEAAQHVVVDHLNSCAVVDSLYSTRLSLSGGAALGSFKESFLVRHALDGLFRPPRHFS
jgi:hypothetical protein